MNAETRKRAKDIVVGDIYSPRFSFKMQTYTVVTVETTPKGKIIVNKGMGHLMGEDVFEAEQWVEICSPSTRDGKCHDDSCDLSHCAKCGSHMLGGHLEHGAVCDSCTMEEEHNQEVAKSPSPRIYCQIDTEGKRVFARLRSTGQLVAEMGWDRYVQGEPEPRLTLHNPEHDVAEISIHISDLDIIMDNWNQMVEMTR